MRRLGLGLGLVLVACAAAAACGSLIPDIKGPSCSVDSARGCACTVGTLNSFQCDESSFQNSVCCATTGWPNTGTCTCDPAPLPTCTQSTDGGCVCFVGNAPDAGDTVVSSCFAAYPAQCCVDANQRCSCQGPCGASSTPVDSCGGPVPNCGSNVHLSSCSN